MRDVYHGRQVGKTLHISDLCASWKNNRHPVLIISVIVICGSRTANTSLAIPRMPSYIYVHIGRQVGRYVVCMYVYILLHTPEKPPSHFPSISARKCLHNIFTSPRERQIFARQPKHHFFFTSPLSICLFPSFLFCMFTFSLFRIYKLKYSSRTRFYVDMVCTQRFLWRFFLVHFESIQYLKGFCANLNGLISVV